jgi:hypothetical protein
LPFPAARVQIKYTIYQLIITIAMMMIMNEEYDAGHDDHMHTSRITLSHSIRIEQIGGKKPYMLRFATSAPDFTSAPIAIISPFCEAA